MLRYIESTDGEVKAHLITLRTGKEVEYLKAAMAVVGELQSGGDPRSVMMGLLISDVDVRALSEDGSIEDFYARMQVHLEKTGGWGTRGESS